MIAAIVVVYVVVLPFVLFISLQAGESIKSSVLLAILWPWILSAMLVLAIWIAMK